MQRKEIFNELVSAFSEKYSWLGKEFCEQFLLSCASWNIQEHSNPDFRVRRHLLLFWGAGWLKSYFLKRGADLLGEDLCMIMSDVTAAALRGTVDSGHFVSPYALKRPFGICTEFGQVVGGSFNVDIIQKLLNVLEEGIVNVSLAKISSLRGDEIESIQETYRIKFLDKNTFTYRTNWVLMAATYNKRFLIDNAFESRFHIMIPSKRLDSRLVMHIHNSKPFTLDGDIEYRFREELKKDKPIDCSVKLPNSIYNLNISMRDLSSIISDILCYRWWGIELDDDTIVEMANKHVKYREEVWKTAADKVFDIISSEFKTVEEIEKESGFSKRTVYNALKELRASKDIIDGKVKYKIM